MSLESLTAADLGIPLFPAEAIPAIDVSQSSPYAYIPYLNTEALNHYTHFLVQYHTGNIRNYLSGSKGRCAAGDLTKMIVHHLSYDVGTIDPLWGQDTFWRRVENMRAFGIHTLIAPDFSTWADYPLAVQIHNLYRSAVVSRDLARVDFKVIPNVTWSVPALTGLSFSIWPKEATVLLVDASHVNTNRWTSNQELFWAGARKFKEYWPEVVPWLWASSPKVIEKWRLLLGPCVWCPSRVYVLGQLQKQHEEKEKLLTERKWR